MNHIGTIRLETDRLILRRFTKDDAEEMFNNCYTKNRYEIRRYITSEW